MSQWLAAARRGGRDARLSHLSHCGMPPPRLTPEQMRLIPDLLWHGPESYGFRGDVWTCERVAGVLYEEFGISYSKIIRTSRRCPYIQQPPPLCPVGEQGSQAEVLRVDRSCKHRVVDF